MIGTDECRCARLDSGGPCWGCLWKAASPAECGDCKVEIRFATGEWRDVYGSHSDPRDGHRHAPIVDAVRATP